MTHNHYNIIQWNCRGLRSSREELEILIQNFNPVAFCIQETKLWKNSTENDHSNNKYHQSFKNHICYYSNTTSGSGGVGIIVKDSFLHRQIDLKTDLQAVAVNITIGQKAYTFCSIYIPPSSICIEKQ